MTSTAADAVIRTPENAPKKLDKPSYEDLMAVAESVRCGTSEYDTLSEIADRVLDGYPEDQAEYLHVRLPEIAIGEAQTFNGGACKVTRTGENEFLVDDHEQPETMTLHDAIETIPYIETFE